MRVVDRFTRDRISRYLWGGLTVGFAILLVYAASGSRRALADRETEAQARAVGDTESTLFRNLSADLMSKPILGPKYRALLIPVQAEIMTDPSVARVRIWGTDGTLLFSTDEREGIGKSVLAGNDASLRTALGGETTSVAARESVSVEQGIPPRAEQLYETFVPLHVPDRTAVIGASEIDMHLAPMIAASHGTWRWLEVAFAAGVLLFLLLTVLSLRAPLEPAEAYAAAPRSPPVSGSVAPEEAPVAAAVPAPVAGAEGERLHVLEERLMQEQMRRANAERAARDAGLAAEAAAGERARELEIEIRTLRERLEEAPVVAEGPGHPEVDVGAIRLELDAVRRELEGVRSEVEAARSEREAARADAERAREELAVATSGVDRNEPGEPAPPAPGPEPDAVAPETGIPAADLRERLARTAARKRRSGEPTEPSS